MDKTSKRLHITAFISIYGTFSQGFITGNYLYVESLAKIPSKDFFLI